MENVSESLAGRLGLVRMTPFILPELKARQMDDLWLCGGYPDGGILDPSMYPEWQDSYLEILATRDLPNWGLSAKPRQTLRLFAMLRSERSAVERFSDRLVNGSRPQDDP